MGNLTKFKICLLLLVMSVYLVFSSGMPWIEANYQLIVSKNIVRHHTLSSEIGFFRSPRDGKAYDDHGLANILLMTPLAAFEIFLNKIGYEDTAKLISFLGALSGVLVNSATCLIFFSLLLFLKRPLKVSFYTTISLAFLTILFPYSSNNYEGNIETLFILSSLYFVFLFAERKKMAHLVLSGTFMGLAVNTNEFSWLIFTPVVLFLFLICLKERDAKVISVFIAAFIPWFLLWGYYNWIRTGVFYITPIAMKLFGTKTSAGMLHANIISGLKGLLFSKGANIFAYSPVLLLSMLGWKRFFNSRKKECGLVLCIIVLALLANAKFEIWFGFCGWGPRYTLPLIPLLMLPLGYWFTAEGFGGKIKRYSFVIVGGYSLIIQLAGTLVNWHARLWELEKFGRDAILYTAKYSQWYDSLKILCINVSNLLFGRFFRFESPCYPPGLSKESLYASTTLFTWWNRLLFMGIPVLWIILYLFLTLITIFSCLAYMNRGFSKKVIKERILKRVFDILFSGLCVIILSPVFLLVALSLKLEGIINSSFKGPVFYKETRVSRGRFFELYKFRVVTREVLETVKKEKRSIAEFTASSEKRKYLTPVGFFLTRIYLDELPQVFNVIKGDMSLVGPRPHIPWQYESDLECGAVSAKYIKAGLFGLVQASKGHQELREAFARMAEKGVPKEKTFALIDRLYFRKYLGVSAIDMLFYDLWIMWRCILVVWEAKGI